MEVGHVLPWLISLPNFAHAALNVIIISKMSH
jgi:hypothetical protein